MFDNVASVSLKASKAVVASWDGKICINNHQRGFPQPVQSAASGQRRWSVLLGFIGKIEDPVDVVETGFSLRGDEQSLVIRTGLTGFFNVAYRIIPALMTPAAGGA
jgi:hypothetical protein